LVAVRVRAVIAAAQATAGVGPGDVTTGSVSVRRVKKGTRPVYRASEGVTVVTHEPDEAGNLVAAGVTAGATSTRGPTFFVGDEEAAYDAALVEALKSAKAKAEKLAAAVGSTLGPAIAITEGGAVEAGGEFQGEVFSPKGICAPTTASQAHRRHKPASASACATPPPVKPGKSTVTASINATFALQSRAL
jgi:uncharacterized protein YggE